MINRSTSAPPLLQTEVRVPIDREDDPVQSEITIGNQVQSEITEADEFQTENQEGDPSQNENGPRDNQVQSEEREVDRVQQFIDNFISERKLPISDCLDLYTALVHGDVEEAISLIQTLTEKIRPEETVTNIRLQESAKYRLILRYPITETDETVFHVAAGAKRTLFVQKMLQYIEAEVDLKLVDNSGNNAFCFAAMVGAKEIAEMMLNKNPDLLKIKGVDNKMSPLYLAVIFGQKDMATFLYQEYNKSEMEDIEKIFFESMRSNLYDLALKLLADYKDKNLALVPYAGHGTALHMLARNPSAFTSRGNNFSNHSLNQSSPVQLLQSLWDDIKRLKGEDVGTFLNENKELLFDAAKLGNSKFLAQLIKFYPNLVRIMDGEGRTIFHIAVLHRHADIFKLMNGLGFNKMFVAGLKDKYGNNLLHLAATCLHKPVGMVPGAALRMQQELKTFKKVEQLVMPAFREMQNDDGHTPQELFTKEHKKLVQQGERWMEKTANSCMLVATIITTVVFTAAFNVPGDYNDGVPTKQKNIIFCSFIMAVAVSLSSASISILLFLSILTSHYEEEDFLKSLPLKLMLGVIALFISISTMMISFSLSVILAYSSDVKVSYKTIPILVSIFLSGPVILFLVLQRRLFKDVIKSLRHSLFSSEPIEY